MLVKVEKYVINPDKIVYMEIDDSLEHPWLTIYFDRPDCGSQGKREDFRIEISFKTDEECDTAVQTIIDAQKTGHCCSAYVGGILHE